ncbi:RimJ/RimL family protein N-acetyltransferase [Kribbella orskensis]|uniref:RimJ/RimL family protein N-acetyltransferase n=1 Tax=Kribbella orskensis TaxID=2512216 RepID=A0ABY2BQ26_9ACTN|nr:MULTISPECIES: GNAT family protein [Kribbella]TCN39672.1 RimJ/RimL family protein N-acetyltransferase [Kribbella sp. VKM Ac-2500]TCO27545.1 RimJ/RimL family protein N-acetyltransferase [Kribbella orskensis]
MDPLTGDGTRLREFRLDDLDDYLAIVGDDRVTNWLSFDSRDRDSAQTALAAAVERSQQDDRLDYMLAVTRLDDDRLIGFARLGPTGVQAAHLGYAIAADHWGHGYATDASRTLVRFAFENLDLHRVSAAIGPENLASVAVVKRLGFSYEGRIRHHVFTNNAWRDSLLYSILAGEYRG